MGLCHDEVKRRAPHLFASAAPRPLGIAIAVCQSIRFTLHLVLDLEPPCAGVDELANGIQHPVGQLGGGGRMAELLAQRCRSRDGRRMLTGADQTGDAPLIVVDEYRPVLQ